MPIQKVFFIGVNALGDTLCTTPVIRAFRRMHPDTFITYIVHNATYCRVLDANPDIDLVLYNEHLWLRGMNDFSMEWFHSLPLDLEEAASLYHFDMTPVCMKAESFHEHIALGFSKVLNIAIDSVRPVVRVTEQERRLARAFVRKPYVIFSTHSNANPLRVDGRGGGKDWPGKNWIRLAEHVGRAYGLDVISVGGEKDRPAPSPYMRSLYGLPIKIVAALIEGAACVVTLENGIAHLAAAFDAPAVEIYSNIVPLGWANPRESTRCRILYDDPRSITHETVIAALEWCLSLKTGEAIFTQS